MGYIAKSADNAIPYELDEWGIDRITRDILKAPDTWRTTWPLIKWLNLWEDLAYEREVQSRNWDK